MQSRTRIAVSAIAISLLTSGMAKAAETISYTYDRLGRLTAINRTGGPSDGAATTYSYDPSGNRLSARTTGAGGVCLITVPGADGPFLLPVPGCRVG